MKDQILALEKKYWNGMETHNYETVKSLTHFPCIVAGKDGVRSVEEAEFKKMFDSGANVQWKVLDISGEQVECFENTAVIAYQIELEKDGAESMSCACSSTWIKESDNWVCAMHTETSLAQEAVHN